MNGFKIIGAIVFIFCVLCFAAFVRTFTNW
jgi:hypothetical protein